jgi:chemotaxis protein MotB
MPDDEAQQPIIIKKKKGGHGGHHGGSWKVAYADFVTSMMAFFLVMWLMVQPEDVREHVAGYFQDPTGYKQGGYKSILPGKGTSIIDLKHKNSAVRKLDRKKREEEMRRSLQEMGEKLMKKFERMPGFKAIEKQIEIEMTAEGLRVQLVESAGQPFFEKGSAELLPHTRLLLKLVSQELSKIDNDVIIEGHTDSLRYADNASYTNWELSADRANSARQWMEDMGLSKERVSEVRGFAFTQPRIEDNPGDPRNRRIAIIVVNDYSGMSYLDKSLVLDEEEPESTLETPEATDQTSTSIDPRAEIE